MLQSRETAYFLDLMKDSTRPEADEAHDRSDFALTVTVPPDMSEQKFYKEVHELAEYGCSTTPTYNKENVLPGEPDEGSFAEACNTRMDESKAQASSDETPTTEVTYSELGGEVPFRMSEVKRPTDGVEHRRIVGDHPDGCISVGIT